MSDIIDKLFVVEGEEIEFRDEIKQRIQDSFDNAVDTAVNDNIDEAEVGAIEIVLDTMDLLGMRSSRILVEQRLIDDNVIVVDGDKENESEDDEDDEPDKKKGKIKETRDPWINEVVAIIG